MNSEKSVMIIDQNSSFREGLKDLVKQTSGYRFIAEAASGQEGMDRARETAPDLIIMECTPPDMSGMAMVRELKRLNPPTKILVLCAQPQYDKVTQAIRAGARGFAVKGSIGGSFVEAMNTIGQGNYFLDDAFYDEVLTQMLTGSA